MIWRKSATTWICEPEHIDAFELEMCVTARGFGLVFTIDSASGGVLAVQLLAPARVRFLAESLRDARWVPSSEAVVPVLRRSSDGG
jgi:hypothetical protein